MSKKEKSEAAEKIVKAEKEKAKKPKSDKPNFFKRAGKAITRFVKDFRGETKKIVWPDGKTVLKNTGVVLIVVAVFLVYIYLVDQGLALSIKGLSNVARGESVSQTVPEDSHADETAPAIEEETEAQTEAPEEITEAPTEAANEAPTEAATDAAE